VKPRQFLALGVLGAITACIAVAAADEDSDRANLITKIENKLGAAAQSLYGVQSNSQTAEIESSSRTVGEVEALVEELKRLPGTDPATEKVRSNYPGYARSFYPAADHLKTLKARQMVKGEGEAQCKDLDSDLAKAIARMKDDPDAAAEIIAAARDYGTKAEKVMYAATAQAAEVKSALNGAQNFSASDGGWNEVTKNLQASASAVATDWSYAYDRTKVACEPLTRKEAHPAVEKALAKLTTSTDGRKQLLQSITKSIDGFADRIRQVPDARDTSSIDTATDQLTAVDAELKSLANVQGDDARTKAVVEKWQSVSASARASLSPLRQLKLHHRVLDELPAKCDDMERQLDAFIRQHDGDADAVEAIPAFAEKLGAPVIAGMEKARERQKLMGNDRDSVTSFSSSEGPWYGVTSAYKEAATTIAKYYDAGMATLDSRCGNISLTIKHPKVIEAVNNLYKNSARAAVHNSDHDRTCQGVPAGGKCTQDAQCLDGTCKDRRCVQCPSQADGRCHPPGLCEQRDYDIMIGEKDKACAKPFASSAYVPKKGFACEELAKLCDNGTRCMLARFDVMYECFRGGDTRHQREYEKVEKSVKKCTELLEEKRRANECTN